MNTGEQERMKQLLREAMQSDAQPTPTRDLWPAMLVRIGKETQRAPEGKHAAIPWYDWALAAGLCAMALVTPVSIPVLLYYL